MLFSHGRHEYACTEAGTAGDAYNSKLLTDGSIKVPRLLKDMLCRLAKQSPGKLREIQTVGFLVNGQS